MKTLLIFVGMLMPTSVLAQIDPGNFSPQVAQLFPGQDGAKQPAVAQLWPGMGAPKSLRVAQVSPGENGAKLAEPNGKCPERFQRAVSPQGLTNCLRMIPTPTPKPKAVPSQDPGFTPAP